MIFTSVDLPAPFSPTRAWIEPSVEGEVPERSATTAPNDLTTRDSSSAGGAGVGSRRLSTGTSSSLR